MILTRLRGVWLKGVSGGAMGGGLMSAGILKNLDVNDTAKANNLNIE